MLCTHKTTIFCQFGNLEICPNFANPYLTQFSSISGGNCIRKGQSKNFSAISRRNSGCLIVLYLSLTNSLRLQESHFFRDLCNKTMTSGRFMSWILCGDSRLNQQIPLPLRPTITFFGMQPNKRNSMMTMNMPLKKNNSSLIQNQRNIPHIQFTSPHFTPRCHRSPSFLPKSGKHFLRAPNK